VVNLRRSSTVTARIGGNGWLRSNVERHRQRRHLLRSPHRCGIADTTRRTRSRSRPFGVSISTPVAGLTYVADATPFSKNTRPTLRLRLCFPPVCRPQSCPLSRETPCLRPTDPLSPNGFPFAQTETCFYANLARAVLVHVQERGRELAEFLVFECRQCHCAYAGALEAGDRPVDLDDRTGLCGDCVERLVGWCPADGKAEEVESREDSSGTTPNT
jgi:hypothetical protein